MKNNIQIEKEIDELRNEYIPIAERGSILYFVVATMSKIVKLILCTNLVLNILKKYLFNQLCISKKVLSKQPQKESNF